MTREDSDSDVQPDLDRDSGFEDVLDALEAELVPDRSRTQESDSDTESLRQPQPPTRWLVIIQAPDAEEVEAVPIRDLLFVPEARNVSVIAESGHG